MAKQSKLSFNSKARITAALLTALTIGSLLDLNFFTRPESHARRFLQAEDAAPPPPAAASTSIKEPNAARLIKAAPATAPDSTRRLQTPSKPIMSTFFEPVAGGCCGMTEEGHQNLVTAWRRAWELYGWDTRILTENDAKKHPRFEELSQKLVESDVNGYNQRCFWRWLAMSLDNNPNGGWMSDYDFFPLRLTSAIGKELGAAKGFKSWSVHVPTLIHADQASWNKITNMMVDTIDKDLDVDYMSDMYMLEYLYNHHSEEELGISTWERLIYPGFTYVKDGTNVKMDCAGAMSRLGAHLSHMDTHKAVDNGLFPKVPGCVEGDLHSCMNRRSDAANVMLKQFREVCFRI
ncbi:hypothetical protein ACHAWO_004769 [Cyclotella atomus]|uniref:Uncharacterized protein n=1 Tax=Cyclotella atomus TaxID=382360 RepID=A0ABD3NNG3_9STRA